jgi:hypothetical protein
MSYFTYQINRASPDGQQWEEESTHYDNRGDAFLALVRRLDREYPDQWRLNCGYQFVFKNAYGGSNILAFINEHQSRREELEGDIARWEAKLQVARAELATLEATEKHDQ